jgi:uncharacterized iron-regulated membrane protein
MTLHLVAVAAVVLGVTGTLSIAACALSSLDLAMVPRHLMPRVLWWRAHAAPAMHASLTVLIAGLAGLLIGG